MLVTESGIVTVVRPVPRKTPIPMLFNWEPAPKVTVSRLVALLKAFVAMLVTEFEMTTSVSSVEEKALAPMLVTESPMTTEASWVLEKA